MPPPAVAWYGLPFSSVHRQASNTTVDDVILELRRRAMGQVVPMFPKGARGARCVRSRTARRLFGQAN